MYPQRKIVPERSSKMNMMESAPVSEVESTYDTDFIPLHLEGCCIREDAYYIIEKRGSFRGAPRARAA